jgi:lia operon protein LiaI
MRLIMLIIFTFITGIIVLATLGPLIGFALTLAVLYYGIRGFILADSALEKVGFGIISLIGLSLSLSNSPAIIGLGALILLYYTIKAWKKPKVETDPYDWQV